MSKLKVPKAYIEWEVKDKDGKVVNRGRQAAKSWVGNIVCFLSSIFYSGQFVKVGTADYYGYTPRADLKDTAGVARGVALFFGSATVAPLGARAPAGEIEYGIVVGTGTTPPAIGDFRLQSRISHGSGAGQLQYGAVTVEDMSKDTTWMFRVVRSFTNASGATVTVYEVGLIVALPRDWSYYSSFLLARDVISGGISVPDGATLTLRYIISHSL
jgi:hypothetical protein